LDPYPRVEADGVIFDVFPRLPEWATALCGVPLVLGFAAASPALDCATRKHGAKVRVAAGNRVSRPRRGVPQDPRAAPSPAWETIAR
jgi:hypothetical protein